MVPVFLTERNICSCFDSVCPMIPQDFLHLTSLISTGGTANSWQEPTSLPWEKREKERKRKKEKDYLLQVPVSGASCYGLHSLPGVGATDFQDSFAKQGGTRFGEVPNRNHNTEMAWSLTATSPNLVPSCFAKESWKSAAPTPGRESVVRSKYKHCPHRS